MGKVGCDIWEKWVGGRKQMTSSRKLATPELCLAPLALTSSAMRWAERCPKWRYGERFEAACKKMESIQSGGPFVYKKNESVT